MPSLQIVKRSPPSWLEPPVPTDREGSFAHRLYKPGDAWYATQVPFEGSLVWCMFGDGAPLNLPDSLPVSALNRALGHHQPITLASQHRDARPIIVVLPNFGGPFCVHSPVLREGVYGSSGWTVEGNLEDLPGFSVHPSIDMRSIWHGHIQRGNFVW
jgi:hypothetical protein